ncbi:MAG: hypothetical protein H6738_19370 [Alphaproteobacteria bacterium]|nr:hypothetical protein [Alphaproteobacteria bacterium]MCB9698950.1 hypothetical protein [Alphaproteobacteria bacterium]
MNQDPQVTAVWLWVSALTNAVPMAMSGLSSIYLAIMFITQPHLEEAWLAIGLVAFTGVFALADLMNVAGAAWVGWRAWNRDLRIVRPATVALLALSSTTSLAYLLVFTCCGVLLRPPGLVALVVALLTCPRDLDRPFGAKD